MAKSGFQHGGDAGTAGQQGRRLRLECKKYSDDTSLNDRELRGEIDEALASDEALEAWILVATRSVPEQLAQGLVQKGEQLGVPVIVIDWKDHELAPLAALCAFDPDLVEAEFSRDASEPARALQPVAGDPIAALRRNLQSWCREGLEWLCYLNEVDPQPTADALRTLSANVRARAPEAGVHPGLPARAAALVLWLSGLEADEEMAASIDPRIDRGPTYENDYLANPSRSFFALERRHADIALNDRGLALRFRLERTSELWLDPTFQPPPGFADELRAAAANFDVEKLNRHMGRAPEDYLFVELEPALARCAPDLLAGLVRRKLRSFASCPPESRCWSAIRATDHLILAGGDEALASQALRLSARDKDESREAIAASNLLKIELRGLGDAQGQFDKLIDADLKFIPADLAEVIHIPTVDDVDALLARYCAGEPKQQHDLIVLLSVHPISFSDDAWSWLSDLTRKPLP